MSNYQISPNMFGQGFNVLVLVKKPDGQTQHEIKGYYFKRPDGQFAAHNHRNQMSLFDDSEGAVNYIVSSARGTNKALQQNIF